MFAKTSSPMAPVVTGFFAVDFDAALGGVLDLEVALGATFVGCAISCGCSAGMGALESVLEEGIAVEI